MKRLTILSTAIILSASLAFAERDGFRDRSENWLKGNSSETSGGLRATGDQGWIPGGTESVDPTVQRAEPIGSGLAILVLSGAGYALAKRRRK
ncbi:MAG: hypothetical protein LBG77_00240 [Dysgonamonadaceae bacterium]|jgi:hypothetical protein|nr:hypothetical protein [Dysgonamonadaceae bacterium]